jgi:hypothetical protein
MATAAYKAYQKYKDRYEAFMSERKKLQKRRYDLSASCPYYGRRFVI